MTAPPSGTVRIPAWRYHAEGWAGAGFGAGLASRWRAAGFRAAEARYWSMAGFYPDEAWSARDAGLDWEMASSLRRMPELSPPNSDTAAASFSGNLDAPPAGDSAYGRLGTWSGEPGRHPGERDRAYFGVLPGNASEMADSGVAAGAGSSPSKATRSAVASSAAACIEQAGNGVGTARVPASPKSIVTIATTLAAVTLTLLLGIGPFGQHHSPAPTLQPGTTIAAPAALPPAPLATGNAATTVADISIDVDPPPLYGKPAPWSAQIQDAFIPALFSVRAGQKVHVSITNFDKEKHSFTAPKLHLDVVISPGSARRPRTTSFSFTPRSPGIYYWHCRFPCGRGMHVLGYMMGEVVVTA